MKRGISDTKRYVVNVQVDAINAIVKIDHTLPEEMETVTGVYLSINRPQKQHAGLCSLRFAEGASNSFLMQRVNNDPPKLRKRTYTPLCEHIPQGSTLRGFYRDTSEIDQSYTFKIYIEYIPRHCQTKKS